MTVWADGICINQTDEEDKNTQVRQMGTIYEFARNTIIFLGDLAPEAQSVIDILAMFQYNTQQGVSSVIQDDKNPAHLIRQPSHLEIERLAIEHILQRTWFTRIWVLQELVLSVNPWIQVATSRLRWKVFYNLLMQSNSRPAHGPLKRLYDINHARLDMGPTWLPDANGKSKHNNLLQILRWRRGSGVTNPRDMIYAHLGMLGGKDNEDCLLEKLIQVDYSKSIGEVYTNAALYFIESSGGFGILSHIEDLSLDCRRQGIPSWVSDWTSAQVSPDANTHSVEHWRQSDFSLLYTTFKTGKVLGSIRRVVGIIASIRDDMPPVFDLQTIRDSLPPEPDIPLPCFGGKEFQQEYLKGKKNVTLVIGVLLEHLQNWFREQCQLPLQRMGNGGSVWVENGNLKSKCDVLILLDSSKPFGRVLPKTNVSFSSRENSYHTFSYLIMGMLDATGLGCFSGRKIGFLTNGSLVFVPKFATIGDTICRSYDGHITFVLRKLEPKGELWLENQDKLDIEILEFFTKNKEMAMLEKNQDNKNTKDDKKQFLSGKELFRELDTSRVDHFQFIGECVYDEWNSTDSDSSPMIFALH